MLIVLLVSFFMTIVMFPNEDLSDYVSSLLSRTSGLYIQFDNLGLTIIPGPGFEADDVLVELRGMPALRAGNVQATTSLLKAITAKIGISAQLRNLFGADIQLEFAQNGTAKSGVPFDDVSFRAEKLSLDALMDFLAAANLGGPKVHGTARIDFNKLRVDHFFAEQPSALASIDIPSLSFPAQTLMTQMGPQPIPTLELGHAALKNMKLADGILEIPDLTLGDAKGEFYAKIKGTLGLQLRKAGPAINPEISNLNFNLKVTASKEFVNHNRDLLSGFLALMNNCKQDTATGIDVACNLKIATLGQVPIFTPTIEKF